MGFLAIMAAPVVLWAESPDLDRLVILAQSRDREIRRIELQQEAAALQRSAQDLPNFTPWSVGTGNAGIEIADTAQGTTLSGSPSVTARLGDEGENSIQLTAPFSVGLESANASSSSVSPSLSLTRSVSDVFSAQTVDTDELDDAKTEIQNAQSLAKRRSELAASILSEIKSIFEDSQDLISARGNLEDARTSRYNLVTVQRRSPDSLQVLQTDDTIAAEEFSIEQTERSIGNTLAAIERMTGIGGLTAEDILSMNIDEPASIAFPAIRGAEAFTAVILAEIAVRIAEAELAQALEQNPVSLSFGIRGSLGLSAAEGSSPTGSVSGSGTLSEGTNWSVGVELGYSSAQNSGPSLSVSGTWSPGPSSASSEQNELDRRILTLAVTQAQEEYEATLEAALETIESLEESCAQQDLSLRSWERRMQIAEASLRDAERTFAAGVSAESAVTEARNDLLSLEYAGKILALNRLVLIETINRNYPEEGTP